MYRDLKKGATVEVDAILGDLLEYGRKHGLTTPILQAAFVNLSIYQRGSATNPDFPRPLESRSKS
jgi:2-dehydropantoate 2-reductase